VHQQKFEWSGALAVITSLSGGGFLSYWSQPRNFAAYGIEFFIGFATYWRLLQSSPSIDRGSGPGPSGYSPSELGGYGSAIGPAYGPAPLRIPENPRDLIRTIWDNTETTEHRIKALLALRTQRHSEDISTTHSLRNDLYLQDFDVPLFTAVLRVPFPQQPQPLELNTVSDLISFLDGLN
jgi:hypothetical protein